MKYFLLIIGMSMSFTSYAAEKEDRKPAQSSRNQVLFDRVEISSGKDANGNIVTRIIDRDQRVVCFSYRRENMEGAAIGCLPLVN